MVHVTIKNPEVHPVEEPEVQDPQGLHHPAPSLRSSADDLHDSRNTQQEDLGRVKNPHQRRIQDFLYREWVEKLTRGFFLAIPFPQTRI